MQIIQLDSLKRGELVQIKSNYFLFVTSNLEMQRYKFENGRLDPLYL